MKTKRARKNKKALLIIDVINGLEFAEGKQILKHARLAANHILALKKKLKARGVPVIYVNDHFGRWHSSWEEVYRHCSSDGKLGAEITKALKPEPDDFFILKPKHSGFFSSTLEVFLREMDISELIMTGMAGNICVLFTANDAHMRGYKIHVPENCIASNTKKDNDYAIRQMHDVFGITTKAM